MTRTWNDSQEGEAPHAVLVVEDDEATAEAIAFHLEKAGFSASVAPHGLAALSHLRARLPDAMVLDLMLPHLDGWYVIREVRRWAPALPIVVVTARTNEHDRVEVLALGADDVMSKPFSARELVARVAAAIRRSEAVATRNERGILALGDLMVDGDRMQVTVADRPAPLTPLEMRLLLVLAAEPGRTIGRDEIFRLVWGGERGHGDRSVDVLIRRLRRKVDEVGGGYTYVQTQHGVGYRLEAVPRTLPPPKVPAQRSPVAPMAGRSRL